MAATPKPVRKLMKKSGSLDREENKEKAKKTTIGKAIEHSRKKENKLKLKSLKPEFKKHFGESKEKTAKSLKKISL